MRAENEERRPRQGVRSSSNSSNQKPNNSVSKLGGWHTVPKVMYVVARSGRGRWLLIWDCRSCRERHASYSRFLKPQMRRRAACDQGWITLHTDAEQVAA
jgi:hypothetical protein